MRHAILLINLLILFINCDGNKTFNSTDKNFTATDTTNNHLLKKRWYFRDYSIDSLLGINFSRANTEILANKKGVDVIVALIDTDVNIHHEDLNKQIWINNDEIPDNGKDDDDNGYIDDIHGWNFLSKTNGERILNLNYGSTQFIRKYKEDIENKRILDTSITNLFNKALKDVNDNSQRAKDYYKESVEYDLKIKNAKKSVDSLFNKEERSYDKLDSVARLYEDTNVDLSDKAYELIQYVKFDYSDYSELIRNDAQAIENISNNINSNPRLDVGDDISDVDDRFYGHPKINNHKGVLTHGTEMAGIIAANMKNDKGFEGMSNKIKLMILSIFPRNGAEYDKDIAIAIYYAVNNGAKVINLSSTRRYQTHYYLVEEALEYAESNGVLFITSAGNESLDIDKIKTYPNQYVKGRKLKNFITVGASHAFFGEDMVYEDSNYGVDNVDLFAPGVQFNTTDSKGKYKLVDGTSVSSAIVSGMAGILFSYYPSLSYSEAKECILNGVNKYDKIVNIGNKKLSFKNISKTAGILDAYKVLEWAEKYQLTKNNDQ